MYDARNFNGGHTRVVFLESASRAYARGRHSETLFRVQVRSPTWTSLRAKVSGAPPDATAQELHLGARSRAACLSSERHTRHIYSRERERERERAPAAAAVSYSAKETALARSGFPRSGGFERDRPTKRILCVRFHTRFGRFCRAGFARSMDGRRVLPRKASRCEICTDGGAHIVLDAFEGNPKDVLTGHAQTAALRSNL